MVSIVPNATILTDFTHKIIWVVHSFFDSLLNADLALRLLGEPIGISVGWRSWILVVLFCCGYVGLWLFVCLFVKFVAIPHKEMCVLVCFRHCNQLFYIISLPFERKIFICRLLNFSKKWPNPRINCLQRPESSVPRALRYTWRQIRQCFLCATGIT